MKLILRDTDKSLHVIADSAIARSGQPWFLPDCGENWRSRKALAIRVSRLGKGIAPAFAGRYVDAQTVLWVAEADGFNGLDFMDGRVVCGTWLPVAQAEADERLLKLLVEVSQSATLKTGDIVAAIPEEDAEEIVPGRHVAISQDNVEILKFNIK